MGKVKCNLLGDEVDLFGPGESIANAAKTGNKPRQLLASIIYENHYFESRPRKPFIYMLNQGVDYFDLKNTKNLSEHLSLRDLYKLK